MKAKSEGLSGAVVFASEQSGMAPVTIWKWIQAEDHWKAEEAAGLPKIKIFEPPTSAAPAPKKKEKPPLKPLKPPKQKKENQSKPIKKKKKKLQQQDKNSEKPKNKTCHQCKTGRGDFTRIHCASPECTKAFCSNCLKNHYRMEVCFPQTPLLFSEPSNSNLCNLLCHLLLSVLVHTNFQAIEAMVLLLVIPNPSPVS